MTFEEKLKQLIKSKYNKLGDLAEKFEMNYSQLSQYVNGKKISIDFLNKIIEEFPEVDLNWLLRDSDAVREGTEVYKPVLNKEQIIESIESLLVDLRNQMEKE